MKIRQSVVIPFLLSVLGSAALCSAQAVPQTFMDLYSALQGKLGAFDNSISARWDGTKSPVVFAGGLTTANGNGGAVLLVPSRRQAVQLELSRMASAGAKAVVVNISFPLFYQPFFDYNGTSGRNADFTDFYKFVAGAVRSQGMYLIVETGVLFPGIYSAGSGFNLTGYYGTLDANAYMAGRAAAAAAIATAMKPDFLSVGGEPDNEAAIAKQPFEAQPAGFASLVKQIITQVRQTGSLVPIGAGVGTWASNGAANINAIAGAGVDYIDLHVYPVNLNFTDNTIALADQASSLGLPVAVSEAWLLKERDSEFGQSNVATDPSILARDVFSFWSPLDQQFLSVMGKFANWKKALFISPFWTKYFWAYLDYSQMGTQPADQLINLSNQASAAALVAGNMSPTGAGYSRVTAPPLADSLVAALSTASFLTTALGPNSIATVFGANLAAAAGPVVPPQTTLGGASVSIVDSAGKAHSATLYSTTPTQINFVIPTDLSPGWAKVAVQASGGVVAEANIRLRAVAPAVFTGQQSGSGVAAAIFTLLHVDGSRTDTIIFNCTGPGSCTPVPLALGAATDRAFLTLYGSGIRGRSSLANVNVMIGAISVPAFFAGPQPQYPGMDQVNIELPKSVAGQGLVDVTLVVDGAAANTVQAQFQ